MLPPPSRHTSTQPVYDVSLFKWVWMWRRSIPCGGTWEPCADMHHTAHYIAWSYREQERRGGTEALQMFSITGPRGRAALSSNTCFCENRRNLAKYKRSNAANDRKMSAYCWRNIRRGFLAAKRGARFTWSHDKCQTSLLTPELHSTAIWVGGDGGRRMAFLGGEGVRTV